jgi:hypothetical protein
MLQRLSFNPAIRSSAVLHWFNFGHLTRCLGEKM